MKTILAMLFSSATFFAIAQDTAVIQMEYFIDNDPGVGNATAINIPAAADVNFPFTVSLTGYSHGYHKLYIRTRDDMGRWSHTARRNIEVLPSSTLNNVINGEYFIDQDPGFGAGGTITINTAGEEILQNFSAALAGRSTGYHKLYGRVRDMHGNWSITFRRNIEVIKDETAKVINGEYFFKTDNGFGGCTPVVFANASADGSFTFNVLPGQIPTDADTLFVRVRDDIQQNWSITTISAVSSVLPLTMLKFTAEKDLNTVVLKWQTSNEVNTAYFNVQRSTDAVHFVTVGKVNPANVHSINNYLYEDDVAAVFSPRLYYRVQTIDRDAASVYSEIRMIDMGDQKNEIRLYPNPTRDHVNIISAMPERLTGSSLTVADGTGRVVLTQKLSATSVQRIEISKLKKGLYLVRISKATGTETFKMIKE